MALLSAKQLAAELNVNPRTIVRLFRRGLIPAERIGRMLRFDLAEVRAEMRKRATVEMEVGVRSG